MRPLTVGGQCEGFAGLFMALQQHLNVEHAWYAEVDSNASKVLAHHYPGVPNHGDITAYDWTQAERVDVFTSGFPCQGFSHAGKRKGSADERHLWPTGVLPAIRELMPPLVVLENVPGLLTIERGQVFGTVLADLDELGYSVSWTTVGACKVGACHHRHRVFIAATLTDVPVPMSDPVAHRRLGALSGGWAPAQDVLFGDFEALRWPSAGFTAGGTAWDMPVNTCGSTEHILPTPRTSDTNGSGQHGNGGLDLRTAVAMLPTPVAHDDGKSPEAHLAMKSRMPGGARTQITSLAVLARNALRQPGDAPMLPTPVAGDADRASATYSRGNPTLLGSLLPTPRASDGEKGGPNQRGSSGDVMLPAAVQPQRFGKYAAAVARHEVAFGLSAPDPTEPGRNGKPRLAPQFPEWMQGLPQGHITDVVDRAAALRIAGNGVNWRQCAYALSLLPSFRVAVKALVADRMAVAA